ncbi:MAG: FAD-dependent oxidoreductase [Pseudomonadota bacterium]|nr:FAD-dependent oxidoreductase [Pseudomonadota bacterium]
MLGDTDIMKIGIIGAGISGLGAAYLLSPDHDITVFEKNDYIGGHSRTIVVKPNEKATPGDTGFIVFNDWNYPNLFGLFKALDVPYIKSDMSFGVSIKKGWLEYSSNGLFAQTRNVFRPAYWKMLADIIRFNKQAPAYIEKDSSVSLGQCLDDLNMGEWFRQYYLLAMGAAIWSCPLDTIMKFPAKTFLRFFKNHGLLNIVKRPQWYTVQGGSCEYVKRLTASVDGEIHKSCPAKRVFIEADNKITVIAEDGSKNIFDHVIFACHADEALALIDEPTQHEVEVLGNFKYQDNEIVVHTDESFMPVNRKCWASWIYLSEAEKDTSPVVSLSYWMNNLQSLEVKEQVLVTLNPGRKPDETKILDTHMFSHPIFDKGAIDAQQRIDLIQGARGLWFCGAYQRYGFHEDGLLSAVNVAKSMGARIPWE